MEEYAQKPVGGTVLTGTMPSAQLPGFNNLVQSRVGTPRWDQRISDDGVVTTATPASMEYTLPSMTETEIDSDLPDIEVGEMAPAPVQERIEPGGGSVKNAQQSYESAPSLDIAKAIEKGGKYKFTAMGSKVHPIYGTAAGLTLDLLVGAWEDEKKERALGRQMQYEAGIAAMNNRQQALQQRNARADQREQQTYQRNRTAAQDRLAHSQRLQNGIATMTKNYKSRWRQ